MTQAAFEKKSHVFQANGSLKLLMDAMTSKGNINGFKKKRNFLTMDT